jgi:hypothetical protein
MVDAVRIFICLWIALCGFFFNSKGGKGNYYYLSNTNKEPKQFEVGHKGEIKELVLELKVVADAGLVCLFLVFLSFMRFILFLFIIDWLSKRW